MVQKDMNVLVVGRNSATRQLELLDVRNGKLLLGESDDVIGKSAGDTIEVNPTVTAGGYVADDVVGGRMEFAGAGREATYGGLVIGVSIIDDAGQDVEMELWLFNSQPDDIADNAAFAPTEADLHNLAGIISTADGSWRAAGTPSVCYVDKYVRYDPSSGTSIYGFLVTRGTPTFAATDDITVILHVQQD